MATKEDYLRELIEACETIKPVPRAKTYLIHPDDLAQLPRGEAGGFPGIYLVPSSECPRGKLKLLPDAVVGNSMFEPFEPSVVGTSR